MILLLALACASGEPPLRVLAPASLTEVIDAAERAWEAETGREVVVSVDGTARLAAQLAAGAPADVFLSADEAWMDALAADGTIRADTRADLLANRLVVVVPAGDPDPDLATVDRIALAGPTVPAGRYARQALGALADDRVVSGDDVRTVLAWVARGEAPVGVVYASDAAVEPRVRVAWTFPAHAHAPIVYPAAVTAHAHDPDAAGAFVDWLGAWLLRERPRLEARGLRVLP